MNAGLSQLEVESEIVENIPLGSVEQFTSELVVLEQSECENAVTTVTADHDNTNFLIDSTLPVEFLTITSDNVSEKFNLICRCCLQQSDSLISIFEEENCVREMIGMMVSSVQIVKDDGLPTNICSSCYDLLGKFVLFKQLMESSDTLLRQTISQICQENVIAEEAVNVPESQSSESIRMNNVIIETESSPTFEDIIEEDFDDDYVAVYEVNSTLYPQLENESLPTEIEDPPPVLDDLSVMSPELMENEVAVNSILDPKPAELIENSIKCQKCNETFETQSLLTDHLKEHSKRHTRYSCSICNKTFTLLTSLDCHMVTHQEENVKEKDPPGNFNCLRCDATFTVERDFYIHGSLHEDSEIFRCRECLKVFPNLPKLRRHVKTHYEDKPIKCTLCGRGFPEMASMTRHLRIHATEPRDRNHNCTRCGKAYFDSHSLLIHMRTHTGEKPWVCTKCDKRFIDSRLLNSHMKVHQNVRNYTCTVCERKFTHRSTLVSHMRTHTGEKPFVCTVCNKSFIQSSNLMLHIRMHSGEKPFQCTRCTRAFCSSSTLVIHMRTHTGEKPYSCKLCGKRFARHNLKIHMRTHTGEKPFECDVCERKFATSGQLINHQRIHRGDKPYACRICNKKWTCLSYLKKHMKKHSVRVEEPISEPDDSVRIEEPNSEADDSVLLEQNSDFRNHRIRIEEIQSDAEFNENAMLVNDLLASVENVNTDVLQGGNVEIPELSTNDSNQGGDMYVTEEA